MRVVAIYSVLIHLIVYGIVALLINHCAHAEPVKANRVKRIVNVQFEVKQKRIVLVKFEEELIIVNKGGSK